MQAESYNFECNKNNSPLYSNKTKLDQCIDSIIRKEGYISCDVEKIPISTDGGNYLGDLYEINIKGKTEDGEKETPIFVKTLAANAIDMEVLSLDDVYVKELFAYTELCKVFNELQDEANVPINERFKQVKSYDESYPKAIILENLTKRGFKTLYRMDCVSLVMAEACIKQLARFHGLSFVIKYKRPTYFENTIKTLDHPYQLGEPWEKTTSKFIKITLDHLDEDLRRRVEDKIPGVVEKFVQYVQDEGSKFCVCHGDYKPSNIMVKEMDGKIEVIPVDYQLIHYGNPLIDFIYFMYTGTDYEFRQKHTSYLKDLYFETLQKYLLYFDMPVESVFPRKWFEKELLVMRDYGLIVSFLFLPFIFVPEERPDQSKEPDLDMALEDRFRDRIDGAIKEFIELGYL